MPGPGIVPFIKRWFGGESGNAIARRNTVFQHVAADPSSPVSGDTWYNTTDDKWRGFDGTSVIDFS